MSVRIKTAHNILLSCALHYLLYCVTTQPRSNHHYFTIAYVGP